MPNRKQACTYDTSDADIVLFIPGLFGFGNSSIPQPSHAIKQCAKILSKANFFPNAASFNTTLFNLYNMPIQPNLDYPSAALCRFSEENISNEDAWMYADPVSLFADRTGLIMRPKLQLNEKEVNELVSDLHPLFLEYHIELLTPTPTRWYLKLKETPKIMTYETSQVVGKDINHYLPKGADSLFWLRLLNETQMTLHNAPANQARTIADRPTINSLWFWGGGNLPNPSKRIWDSVYTDNSIAKGLAKLSATPCYPLPNRLTELDVSAGKRQCIILTDALAYVQHYQPENWLIFLDEVVEKWLSVLKKHLRTGRIKQAYIITEKGAFYLNSYSFLKFWRNPVVNKLFS